MTNQKVIENFIDGFSDKRTQNVYIQVFGSGSTVLYSYGTHFPMAIKSFNNMFLINIDKYSRTTSKQQGLLKRALFQAGITPITKSTEELKTIIRKYE